MTKNPVLGKVKTRLAKTVGEERALEIYLKLLQHTYGITQHLEANKKVFYTDFIPEQDLWQGYQKYLQSEGDLGQKMKNAFELAFSEGYQKVLIIGGDCAELDQEILDMAFYALDTAPVVIGPARDGGYYLLGMTRLVKELFEDKPWSTAEVLPKTLKDLEKLAIPKVFLPTLGDVDVWDDLPVEWR